MALTRKSGKKRRAPAPAPPAEARSFRWPSRKQASAVERAAAVAAQRGLERIHARAERVRAEVAAPAPSAREAPVETEPELAFEEREAVATEEHETVATDEHEAVATREPQPPPPKAPELWAADFDALAEELVAELRRDLGPANA